MRAPLNRFVALSGSITACAMAAGLAIAEPATENKGRFSMTPVEGGFMRLDTITGAVALCTRKADAWACEPVKDGSPSVDETGTLEAENKALKDRIKSLESAKPGEKSATEGDFPTEPPGGVTQLPTEEEVDKAFDYMERMYKKLRDRIKKFESPTETPKTGEGGSGAL